MFLDEATVTLYRPVGRAELEKLKENEFRAWPPRLPEQPIFYPVTNEAYAVQIARDWNVKSEGVGFVTRFHVKREFMAAFPVQTVGGAGHTEWWIPAEQLYDLNANLVGRIEVIHEFSR